MVEHLPRISDDHALANALRADAILLGPLPGVFTAGYQHNHSIREGAIYGFAAGATPVLSPLTVVFVGVGLLFLSQVVAGAFFVLLLVAGVVFLFVFTLAILSAFLPGSVLAGGAGSYVKSLTT